ncbi:MAG: histidine kinase, partial [Bacteroidales bacterium]|nr:histidine kinase [Bacteroidales bacterium]
DFKLNTNDSALPRVMWHVLFWFAYIFFYTLTPLALGEDGTIKQDLQYVLLLLPLKIFATYTLVYYFIPQYLLKRRYFIFIIIIIPLAFVLGFGQRFLLGVIFYPVYYPEQLVKYGVIYWPKVFYAAIDTYSVAAVAAVIKLLKQWFNAQQLNNSLKQEKLAAELKFLKSQIHPHFLFNTLNNIDTLITENPEEASESVMKLSRIMRYMLYDSNTEYVPLSKEISYLNSFISLQKIRLKNPDSVKFEIIGTDKNRLIAPMLLIPFVENAFKHGAIISQSHRVLITLTAEKKYLEFEVINDISESETISKDSTQGIGLNNVKRRLELIYKDQYSLEIDSENNKFIVKLKLHFYAN